MIDSMQVLDVLRERGYVPQDDPDAGESWFDRSFGPATVRAVLTPEDSNEIYLFIGPMVCEWSVRFGGAPGAVFLATLDAAEAQAQEIADMHTAAYHPRQTPPCPDCGGVGSAHANACDPD